MLWFGSNKNGGHDKPQSGELGHVHGPVIIGHNGGKHSIDLYESHNSEQYMARTKKVVKYRRFPGMADEEYNPSKTEEYGRFNSPPSKDHHRTTHGKSGNVNFDTDLTDEDDEEEDLSVNNTNGTRPNNTKEREYHNDEKNRRYGLTKEGFRPNHLKDQEDYYERRYGMGAPGAGPGLYAENKYSGAGGTIDCKEAARRYNGVLLTN